MSLNQDDHTILASFEKFIVELTKILSPAEYKQTIDPTIGAYIINTIKQFYTDYEDHKVWLNQDEAVAQSFTHIDSLVEVIDAYLIGFNQIPSAWILEWLIELKTELDKRQLDGESESRSLSVEPNEPAQTPRDSGKKVAQNESVESPCLDDVKQLVEMFPQFTLKEINKIYKKRNCNYEATIDELVILENASVISSDEEVVDDENDLTEEEKRVLKERTVQKFGFVAVNEGDPSGSTSSIKPIIKWNSEKKLIRYFDSKVVTTKGEKYFEPKTEKDEELEKQMKTTYVNLKPARKYRFH